MKIRGLVAGLLVAVAIAGCTGGSPTIPERSTATPAAFNEAPPPPDTLTNRGGGTMGTGT